MPNLTFPQLSSGAAAQYPIRKDTAIRTVKNILPDASVIAAPDATSGRLTWQLSYVDLSLSDVQAIQSHFLACSGRFHSFNFIDPTDNLFASSAQIKEPDWAIAPGVNIQGGAADPAGAFAAFTVTNNSQAPAEISQYLVVPAGYRYCLSGYFSAHSIASVSLTLRGSQARQDQISSIGVSWQRISLSGQLSDSGTGLSAGFVISPGQSVTVYGMQLEAQAAPSRYRATYTSGGIYPNAHWAMDELVITEQAPGLFTTSLAIETNFGS